VSTAQAVAADESPTSPDALFAKAEAARIESKRLAKESEELDRQARVLYQQQQRRVEIARCLFSWQHPTEKERCLDVYKEGEAIVFEGRYSDYEVGPVPLPPEAVQRLIEALSRAVVATPPRIALIAQGEAALRYVGGIQHEHEHELLPFLTAALAALKGESRAEAPTESPNP